MIGTKTGLCVSGENSWKFNFRWKLPRTLIDGLAPFYGPLVQLLSLFPYQCQIRPPVSLWWWIHGKPAACEPCWAVCSSLVSRVVKCTKILSCGASLISWAKKGHSLRVQEVRWKHEWSLARRSWKEVMSSMTIFIDFINVTISDFCLLLPSGQNHSIKKNKTHKRMFILIHQGIHFITSPTKALHFLPAGAMGGEH